MVGVCSTHEKDEKMHSKLRQGIIKMKLFVSSLYHKLVFFFSNFHQSEAEIK